MSWVKEIVTNIKSPDGNSRTYELGKHTLLVGPNESGKSAIAEAVQLALTGSSSGLLYRNKPIKSGPQLSVLRPEGVEVVFAQAMLDDGQSAEWSLEKGKRPKKAGVSGVSLPVNDLKTVMAGSDTTIRAFFYENMLKETPWEDVVSHLPENLHAAFNLWVPKRDSINMVDAISALGKKKREVKAHGAAAQRMLESLTVVAIDDAEIDGLWEQYEQAEKLDRLRKMYANYRKPKEGSAFDDRALSLVKKSLAEMGTKEELKGVPTPKEAREAIADVYQAKGELASAVSAKKALSMVKDEIGFIGELEKSLQEVIVELLDEWNVWKTFADQVNMFLPKGDTFTVEDNGSLQIGLNRPNGMHTALSGSTEARTLAAMAAGLVITRRTWEGDHPALIVVDDRMWDSKTLAKTMAALEKIDCQVLLMTTSKPRGKGREAWTYVNLGQGS